MDENQARMTDCYTNTGYYIYFYQHIFMIKPKAVYIPRAVEQGVVGMFQESLKQVLDYSETVDPFKPIHASTVNFSVSSSDPYRSRLNIALAVRKSPDYYTVFRNCNSLLQIYICKELASTLNMFRTQLQDFQIQIKDNQDQLFRFEDGRKSIMTLNFKPTKSKELSHFTQTVRCQVPHKLNEPIPLKTTDSWQVALMDITFPRRWINVKENEMVFYMGNDGVYDQDTSVSGGQSTFTPTKYVLPPGSYTNESLVAKMNEMTLNPFTSGGYRFYIYPNSQVFKVDLVKREGSTSNLSVKIPEPLCQVLGWETEKEFNLTAGWEKPDGTDQYQTSGNIVAGTTRGTTYSFRNKKLIKIDVNRGYNIMYVYAPSLIQDVHVGHTKTELLNYTVPGLAEVRGDSYFVQFNSLSYVKVKEQLHSINELLVEIRNELGDLFEFTDVGQRPTASLKFEISDQL